MERAIERRRRGRDWISALLELAALASSPAAIFILGFTAEAQMSEPPREVAQMFLVFALGMGSGLGWLRAGRGSIAAMVAIWRVALVAPYAYFAIQRLGCELTCTPAPDGIIALSAVAFFCGVSGDTDRVRRSPRPNG